MDFPCILIHRSQDTEREPLIHTLEKALGFLLQRMEAIDGASLSLPRKHPHEVVPTSDGNIGCTASHVAILESALKSKWDHVCIFEDDAVAVAGVSPLDFLKSIDKPWDILFFGVNEIVEGELITDSLWRVRRFWGTHAVVVGRRAMAAIVETYKKSIQDGYALPADWLYSWTIRDFDLVAYCPCPPLVIQKRGIVSVISGAVRA